MAIVFLKMIVLLILLYFLYSRIQNSGNKIFLSSDFLWLPFLLAVVLVPFNWFLEWKKWQLNLKTLNTETTINIQRQAFFAGLLTGMLTPNMQGNFLGRLMYFDRRYRIGITVLTLMGNLAQFTISIVFGIISFAFVRYPFFEFKGELFLFFIVLTPVLLVFVYFYFERILLFLDLGKKKIFKWMGPFLNVKLFRVRILVLSFVRHLIFTVQFLLTLWAFAGTFSWNYIFWIWQVYLWVTLSPSLFLGKIGIREWVAVAILSYAGISEINVLKASLSIWVINLLIPTVVAVFWCKKIEK